MNHLGKVVQGAGGEAASVPSTRGRTEIELPDTDLAFREARDDIQFTSHGPNEVTQGADVHVGPAFER